MENLIFGLTVTLIGMAIVFAGLVLLIMLIKLVSAATGGMGKKAKKEQPEKIAPLEPVMSTAAPAIQDDNLMAVLAAAIAAQDEELVAVISAAIAAVMDEGSQFRVRRIRRITNAPAWAKAGREEQIYSRF